MNIVALVHRSDEAFGISFPDFPGCVAGGVSLEEAIERGRRTIAVHLEGMAKDGEHLPQLRPIAVIAVDPSFQEDVDDAIAVVNIDIDLSAFVSDADIAMVVDNPEWTEEDFAKAKRGRDVLPADLLDRIKGAAMQRGKKDSR